MFLYTGMGLALPPCWPQDLKGFKDGFNANAVAYRLNYDRDALKLIGKYWL